MSIIIIIIIIIIYIIIILSTEMRASKTGGEYDLRVKSVQRMVVFIFI